MSGSEELFIFLHLFFRNGQTVKTLITKKKLDQKKPPNLPEKKPACLRRSMNMESFSPSD